MQMFRATVADLNIILKDNYGEQKQLLAGLCQDLSTLNGSVGKFVDNIASATSAAESGGAHKNETNDPKINISVIAMHDYINTVVALDIP